MLHEKLECYRMSVEVAGKLGNEMSKWPTGYGFLADQLRRAMSSVVLNVAEGNARISIKERRRFFQISRASLAEVSACVDLMRTFRLMSANSANEFKFRLDRISRMIYGLCR